MSAPLEPSDLRILRALQNDGRMSNQDLAAKTGMSTSACWRRVRTLENRGVIRKYTAIVDPESCGLEFHAIAQIVLARHKRDSLKNFVAAVVLRPEVMDCFATTGDADYHLRICCKDKDAYNHFLEDFLFALPGVATVRTNLILHEIKQNSHLPLT